jgi:hypothetical protein
MEVLADRCANRLLPGIRAAAIRVEQPFSGLPGMLLVEGRQPSFYAESNGPVRTKPCSFQPPSRWSSCGGAGMRLRSRRDSARWRSPALDHSPGRCGPRVGRRNKVVHGQLRRRPGGVARCRDRVGSESDSRDLRPADPVLARETQRGSAGALGHDPDPSRCQPRRVGARERPLFSLDALGRAGRGRPFWSRSTFAQRVLSGAEMARLSRV